MHRRAIKEKKICTFRLCGRYYSTLSAFNVEVRILRIYFFNYPRAAWHSSQL